MRKFNYLYTVIFIILFGVAAWQFTQVKEDPLVFSSIEVEFNTFLVPSGAQLVGEVSRSPKAFFKHITGHYTTNISSEELSLHYKKIFSANGWTRKSITQESEKTKTIYCKNGLDAILEVQINRKSSQIGYWFGIEWQDGPKVKTGCGN